MTASAAGAATTGRAEAILTLNAGSSSIRFAVYEAAYPVRRSWSGKLDQLGRTDAKLLVQGAAAAPPVPACCAGDLSATARWLVDWLLDRLPVDALRAVGHRVVHGFTASEPQWVDEALLQQLHALEPYDPEHLPLELQLIQEVRERRPELAQLACFDTAFHHDMPLVAQMLPIPRRYHARGVRRYGFHGLSFQHLMEALRHIGDPAASEGRVVLAHLGNGASVAAVRDGRSIDTSMALTPAAGLVMGSRSGDLDPGLFGFLARTEQMTVEQFANLINRESGMLGISELSADMRELLQLAPRDERAAQAVEVFCYQARKWIAAMAAALGGIDLLVFSGGIGENVPVVRERICDGLGFLGVGVDHARNQAGEPIISPDPADVRVRVIATDEELMIAQQVYARWAAALDFRH